MGELYDALLRLNEEEVYPFHMPGHKRGLSDPLLKEAACLDITEISGFGNLYEPEGPLEELKKRAARLYGAKQAFLLVNGSTVGVLSALHAVLSRGGTLLMARNSHRSAYNAARLMESRKCFLEPERISPWGIYGGVTPQAVEKALQTEPGIEAVFITSPTYEGVLSDVRGIAQICHAHGAVLIVDSAHGAHLGFDREYTEKWNAPNAVTEGADVVVESLHKTLPSLTQTAVLFVCSDRADGKRLDDSLFMFQTSSPSYLLMAGMERCFDFLETDRRAFPVLLRRLEAFREELSGLHNIRLFGPELIGHYGISGFDPSRILIDAGTFGGQELAGRLRRDYRIETELAADRFVCALAGVMDRPEGFERLAAALKELDQLAGA